MTAVEGTPPLPGSALTYPPTTIRPLGCRARLSAKVVLPGKGCTTVTPLLPKDGSSVPA